MNTKIAIAVCVCVAQQSFAYSILYDSINYGRTVDIRSVHGIPPLYDYHWDTITVTNDPVAGVSGYGVLSGGNWFGGGGQTREFSVVPDAGDASSGTVQVRFDFQIMHHEQDVFSNFVETAMGSYYDEAELWLSRSPYGPGGSTSIGVVSDRDSSVLLNLDIGVGYQLSGIIIPKLHDTVLMWRPPVIDPSLPGFAYVHRSGDYRPLLLEIPEPSCFSLLILALIIRSVSRSRNWRRRYYGG